ncbi:hypothetical protein AYI69_g1091 [Smittium culicis]|uniref:Uncharacterized protein n=1 Tax=Smittium culicis TaxID=133412 RepID=A0A1R1YRK9_9FUNG|nr:hypothetical protein AYI69_g1091 [Smittium culicis]
MIGNLSQLSSKENDSETNSAYYEAENEGILDHNHTSFDLADQVTADRTQNYPQPSLSAQQSFSSENIELETNLLDNDAINIALIDYKESGGYKYGRNMYTYNSSKYLDDSESASSYNSSNAEEYCKVSRVVDGCSLNGNDGVNCLTGNSGTLHRIKKYSNLTRDFFKEKVDPTSIGESIAGRIRSMVISPSSSSQVTEESLTHLGKNFDLDEFESSSLSKKSSDASYILITPVRNKRSHDSFESVNRIESSSQLHSQEETSQTTLACDIDKKNSSISFGGMSVGPDTLNED